VQNKQIYNTCLVSVTITCVWVVPCRNKFLYILDKYSRFTRVYRNEYYIILNMTVCTSIKFIK